MLDTNVLISGLVAPSGPPARLLSAWRGGRFELIVSARLLEELARALHYPKIRKRVPPTDATAFVDLLRRTAEFRDDPTGPPPVRSSDLEDDFVIALASDSRAVIVTGDKHLLALEDLIPVVSPSDFLQSLAD